MLRWNSVIGTGVLLLILGACASDRAQDTSRPLALDDRQRLVSEACAEAFAAAASVSEFQDTHEDLFPAYSACSSLEEWEAADGLYPDAIDGVEPIAYAMTVCANKQEELGDTAICRAVNMSEPAGPSDLKPSGETGLLGVPLPEGATLIERTPGDPASGYDPSERYAISASAADIAAFFNREMPPAGWAKDGTSTQTSLFFRKGNLMIGILINRDGGTFTLMGS